MNYSQNLTIYLFVGICLLLSTTSIAQDRSCSTMDLHEHKMATNQKYKADFQAKLERLAKEEAKEKMLCDDPVVYPVAVHFQVSGLTESDRPCLEQLAQSQIDILNNDYQGLNADISNWINTDAASFPGADYGQACIEFSLAVNNHPAGYGIGDGDIAVTILANSGDNDNNWDGYINIYVRANTGVLGYSPLGGDGDGDGVVVDASAFGAGAGCDGVVPGFPYHLGRTLTHELGHYFLLNHIWGGGCGADDGVADTPNSQEPYYGCPNLGEATCTSTDMHMNYMDYVNDACMYMFSDGQATRMENYGNANLTNVINNAPNVLGPTTPTVSFVNASINTLEGTSNCLEDGTKIITVEMDISAAGSADADINLSLGGDAVENEDYYLSSSSLFFPAGSTVRESFDIIVFEDAQIESNEKIEISYTLNNNGGDVEKGNSNQEFLLGIINDDIAPSVATSGNANLLTENWEGANSWTLNNTGQNAWIIGTSANLTNTSAYISQNGNAHSYSGQQTSSSFLESPVMNATGYSNISLEFDFICDGEIGQSGTLYDFGTLHYSIDGTNWIQFSDEYQGFSNASTETINLPVDADNAASLQIAFKWENDNSVRNNPPFAVDNIVVSGNFESGVAVQTNLNSSSGYSERELGPFETVHFYDNNNGNIMLTIENESNHDYGCTRVEIDRAGFSSMISAASEADEVTEKTFIVTPESNNFTGTYTIKLYYSIDEIEGWVSDSGYPIEDLRILKSVDAIQSSPNVEVVNPSVENFGADYIYSANFTTGFSGFALGNAVIGLAVEYLQFEAVANKENIILNWSTSSEKNNRGFSLERVNNIDGSFEKIAWIDGHINSETTQTYQFIDTDVRPNQLYYYRLAQTDLDGQINYSNIVNAKILGNQTTLAISPNPIKDEMNLQLEGPQKLDGKLIITDVLGRTLKSIAYSGEQYLAMNLDLSDLNNGVYLIQLYDNEELLDVRKFVKAK